MDFGSIIGPFFQYVLPTLLGSTSIIAVWINWRIEKVRDKNKNRREMISHWRNSLLQMDVDEHGYERSLSANQAYLTLRPHLLPDVRKKLDNKPKYENGIPVIVVVVGGPVISKQEIIADELSRIEKKWDLI